MTAKRKKGFGEIMAACAMEANQERAEDCPPCPLCGHPMEDNGAAFFCRDAAVHNEWLMSRRNDAFEASENGEVVFHLDLSTPAHRRIDNYDPAMQGVIMAVAISPAGNRVFFSTARGRNGETTFRVDKSPDGWKPGPGDWIWSPWALNKR